MWAWLQILRARLIATNSSTESLPTLEHLPTTLPPTYVTTSGQRSCNQDFITVYYCPYFSYICPVALSNDRNHEKNDEIAHCNLQSWVTDSCPRNRQARGYNYVWSRLQLFGQVDARKTHPFSFSVKKIYFQDYILPQQSWLLLVVRSTKRH